MCVCLQILPVALGLDRPDLLLLPTSHTCSSFNVINSHTCTAEKTGTLSHPSPVPYWPSHVDNGALKTAVWDFYPLSSCGSPAVVCLRPLLSTDFCPFSAPSFMSKIFTLTPYLHSASGFQHMLNIFLSCKICMLLMPFLFRRNAMKVCAIFSRAVTLLAIRGINHSDLMTHPAHESFSSLPKPKPGMLGLFLLSSCWSKAVLESGQICQLQHFDLSLWSR